MKARFILVTEGDAFVEVGREPVFDPDREPGAARGHLFQSGLQWRLQLWLNDSGRGLARRIHARKMGMSPINDQIFFQEFYGYVTFRRSVYIPAFSMKNKHFICWRLYPWGYGNEPIVTVR